MERAIALIEVQAMAAAVEGLDAMLKAADVRLVHIERRLGGRMVTIVVDGEVSAVQAAADAGRQLRQIEARQQAPDHPILWNVEETNYLKFFLFQVV